MTREERAALVLAIKNRAEVRGLRLDELCRESERIANRVAQMDVERRQLLAEVDADAKLLDELV